MAKLLMNAADPARLRPMATFTLPQGGKELAQEVDGQHGLRQPDSRKVMG